MARYMEMTGGIKIPSIGLGTGQVEEQSEIELALNTALELGYRHIDTAYAYNNEVFISNVLKKWFSSGKLNREDVFITTKLPMEGVHEDRVEMFMKKSLENLQVDYVDLYLVHFPIGLKYVEEEAHGYDSKEAFDVFDHIEIWKKMEEQVDAGRTKTIGLSNFNQRQIEKIIKNARIKPACLQIELHVDFQQRDLVKFCHDNGIVVVGYSPLGQPGSSRIWGHHIPEILLNPTVKQIADNYEKSNAQILLRYLLQNNIVVIPKSSNPKRLKENLDIFDFTIKPKDMEVLDDLEGGESVRLATFLFILGMEDHPEYPFAKQMPLSSA